MNFLKSFFFKPNLRIEQESKTASGVCYFLVCFKNIEYVAFLMSSIYNTTDTFFIHCDKKSSDAMKRYVQLLSRKYRNVFQLQSQDYSWAGFSQVKVTLDCIEAAFACNRSWSHFICLSEQHLPLKSPEKLRAYLQTRFSIASVRNAAAMVGSELADLKNRFGAVYRELPGVGCFAIALNELDDDFLLTIFHGSNWVVLHQTHCSVLLAARVKGQFQKFECAIHADETAIQSILAPFKDQIANVDATLVALPGLTDNHALVMTEELYRSALNTDYLFIRKRMEALSAFVLGNIKQNHFVDAIIAVMGRSSARVKSDKRTSQMFEDFRKICIIHSEVELQVDRIDPDLFDSVPCIHWIISTAVVSGMFSVRVLSENYIDFKICLVREEEFPSQFELPYIENGILFSTIRARLFGLFCYRDILPINLNNSGFITIKHRKDIQKLYSAVNDVLLFADEFVRSKNTN